MPEAIRCCFFVPCYWELSYVCMPTFIATIANWASYSFIWTDCLRLFIVVYKLNTVYDVLYITCVYIPVFLSLVLIKGSYECIYAIY